MSSLLFKSKFKEKWSAKWKMECKMEYSITTHIGVEYQLKSHVILARLLTIAFSDHVSDPGNDFPRPI